VPTTQKDLETNKQHSRRRIIVKRNHYYWTLIGILGIVAESSHGLELTPGSTQFPNEDETAGASKESSGKLPLLKPRLAKTPLVKDGDGNILGKLVGLGYLPGSNRVDVFTDKGYILQLNSSGTTAGAYGGPIVYRNATCELEEFVINAMNDSQNPPPIVKIKQGVYQDSFGNPVFISKDAVPRSLVYYTFRYNQETGEYEWYGVGGPDPEVINILPNDPSVTGFPGVAGENYPLKTPIEIVY
jgi:hypothetical protein